MNLAKDIYYTACSALPMRLLKKLAPPTTLLPYHHTVSDENLLHIKHLYSYKNISEFNNDLDYLLQHFKAISPQDILDSINKYNKLPANSFLLSFDDGFKEVFHIIAPILEAKGIPAIFFINPAFIDNKELFYRCKTSLLINELLKNKHDKALIRLYGNELGLKNPTTDKIIYTFKSSKSFTNNSLDILAGKISYSFNDYLVKHLPFVTTEQLKSLHEKGFTIGAHSWDHPSYDDISHSQQIEQTVSSCAYVKTQFNVRKYFSFPYSDANLTQKLFDELVKTDVELFFGIQNQKEELQNKMLHRFNAERPEIPLNKQLKGLMTMMAYQKLNNKNKVIRN